MRNFAELGFPLSFTNFLVETYEVFDINLMVSIKSKFFSCEIERDPFIKSMVNLTREVF